MRRGCCGLQISRDLDLGETAIGEALAEALERVFDAPDVDEVAADADDHDEMPFTLRLGLAGQQQTDSACQSKDSRDQGPVADPAMRTAACRSAGLGGATGTAWRLKGQRIEDDGLEAASGTEPTSIGLSTGRQSSSFEMPSMWRMLAPSERLAAACPRMHQ